MFVASDKTQLKQLSHMKQLSAAVKVEFTGSDLLDALVTTHDPKALLAEVLKGKGALESFLKRFRPEVTKAITGYLQKDYAMKTDKVIYAQDGRVIVEARTNGTPAPVVDLPAVRNRVAPEGHTKTNKGVFQSLREYLEDERKKKRKELEFAEVLKDMQFFFPKLSSRHLQIYLHDKRQLKGVDFSAKRGTVLLK